ncbi:glycosyltransferase family 2 protein [Rubrivirga sp.]|uniref:glycosyltransferase family 2 protein n=1 Tax=Rubrivirga sp. TaxID=1885344 RepID=UPI003B524973
MLTVSAIVPVHRGGDAFRRCAAALAGALGVEDEWVVVADGETDGAWRDLPASRASTRTLVHPTPRGPAVARNRGAREARGDVLFFVDADVVVRPDTVERVRAAFQADAGLSALVGSYDDAPGDPAFLSQYRNLLHHHTHQTASEPFRTFWTGCGAVRRDVFEALSGFDEGYARPSIEDIEFGYRLGDAGHRIALDKGLQVTHLKAWRAADMVATDVFRRAAPWTELLLRRGAVEDNLNVDRRSRLSVAAVGTMAAAAVTLPFRPKAGSVAGAAAALSFVGLNAGFYRSLYRIKGLRFAALAVPWHVLYAASSGVGFAVGAARHLARRPSIRLPPAP